MSPCLERQLEHGNKTPTICRQRRRRRHLALSRSHSPAPSPTQKTKRPPNPNTHHKTACIVFGATGSVGSSLVELLATRNKAFGFGVVGAAGGSGPPLTIVAAAPDAVKALKDKFPEGGDAKVVCVNCDGNDAAQVEIAFDMAAEGGATVVAVCNAVGNTRYAPLSEMTAEEVCALVAHEIVPATNILKVAMRRMGSALDAAQEAGSAGGGATAGPPAGGTTEGAGAPPPAGPAFCSSIVYRSASVTHHGMKHHEAFAAAKGAGEAMHLSAAATMAQRGVKVSVVAAGLVESSAAARAALGGGGGGGGAQAQAQHQKSTGLYPPHRLARAEEVAAAMAVAMSPTLLPFTTGAVIPCDGGLSRVQTYAAPTQHV